MEWIQIFTVLFISVSVIADHCPVGNWIKVNGMCYLFSTQKLKWKEAIDECQQHGQSVTSLQFYSKQDKDAFLQATKVMRIERWWTSLNELTSPGTYVWGTSDSSLRPGDGILVWNYEPDDTKHLENCGAISIQATISDEDCKERHGYICEYILTGKTCLNGWKLFNSSCYYISYITDPFNNIPWSDAKLKCNSLAPNAHLLQLETNTEQAFLVNQLPYIKTTSGLWWIGMTDQIAESRWLWVDGSLVNQQSIQWEIEPDNLGGQEHCAMMYNSGVFSDKSCDTLANYVCTTSQIGDSELLDKVGCPPNWIRGGHKCYLFQTADLRSWTDASTACTSGGGRLLQIQSQDEKNWIELQTRYYKTYPFWSGLTFHVNDNKWFWSTGIQADMNLIKWNSEPNNYAGNEDCGEIFQDGGFNDMSCLSKAKYICEVHLENADCPSGWFKIFSADFNSCYFISNGTDLAAWDEAIDKCKERAQPNDGALVAFDSQDELTKVVQFLKQVDPNPFGWWTGLNDRKKDGNWVYYTSFDNPSGGSNVKINWNSEPSNPVTDNCAVIYYGGRYNDVKCNNNVSYICERDAHQPYNSQTSHGFQNLPFYLNTAMMVIICWLY
ncbi:C-type mannose receptor 2-like [Mytilus galloprovincialis]|uniref:C-type mannose receptor 2-like n=1 Tax=Mytilus galloprovincialis TaxID=29158 RepID=UPI003F7C787B